MRFSATGHENVLCEHRNTIEFTHDDYVTKRGDCILAINADYTLDQITQDKFSGKVKIIISVGEFVEEIVAEYNPSFTDAHEMVIRRTDFVDARTFAIRADKVAKDMNRELVKKMQDPNSVCTIEIVQM